MPKDTSSPWHSTSRRYSPVPGGLPSEHLSGPSSGGPGNRNTASSEKGYDLSPAAGFIPLKLDYAHKAWLNQFVNEFGTKVGKRGSTKNNAKLWNREFVVDKFIPQYFNNLSLTDGDKDWVCDNLGEKVYHFLANCRKRATRAKAPKSIVRTKSSGQDAY
ncbi:hypothetical protein FRC12_023008 [Ceratobasidium sp. 428]|nr:hypothetical protein FRC12_023008 [Ceratobasidium sp. 428]